MLFLHLAVAEKKAKLWVATGGLRTGIEMHFGREISNMAAKAWCFVMKCVFQFPKSVKNLVFGSKRTTLFSCF